MQKYQKKAVLTRDVFTVPLCLIIATPGAFKNIIVNAAF